jgi:hypothetical protein
MAITTAGIGYTCRMARLIALLTLLAVGLSACGGDEQEAAESERACPEDTPSLKARDVIGSTPKGYEVVEGDPAALERVASQMKQTMGPAFRDWDARVLAPRRAVMGTAVMVFNANERIPPPEELLRQQEEAEAKAGLPAEAIDVGGEAGRLHQGPDGAWVAVAPAGTCAMVLLASDREKLIRDAATLVLNDG